MRLLAVVHQDDAGPGVFARAFEDAGAEVREWHPAREPEPPPATDCEAAIVLGGAMNVDEERRHAWLAPEKAFLRELLEREVALLGVCLGAQLLAEAAGGAARPSRIPEIGWREVELADAGAEDPLLGSLPARFVAFEWHSYEVELSPDAAALATSACCVQAFRAGPRAWGIQFHAEVTREIVAGWIDKDGDHGDLAGEAVDPTALAEETAARIAEWNELGERLCSRFLELAARTG